MIRLLVLLLCPLLGSGQRAFEEAMSLWAGGDLSGAVNVVRLRMGVLTERELNFKWAELGFFRGLFARYSYELKNKHMMRFLMKMKKNS